ncbi:MAG: acetyl-CoA carboxylase, biotin carboxyl carrier protein [Proteobacteria bacterium]|nr:acetyl-CoA carboxylase, biotin carboxyl carrier protein [Pseudomonadota bacterium]
MTKTKVDKELIRELAALMDETGLSEIEIERDDDRVRLVRAVVPAPLAAVASVPAAEPVTVPVENDLSRHPGALLSPIVGTAYHAPSPEDAPFVKIGDHVTVGQTLLVIEAMKTFNEISATCAGVVRQILFENATPVEYGDVLIIVD